MVMDSGAEVQLVCPAHKHFVKNVTKLSVPLQLETAGGDLTLAASFVTAVCSISCSPSISSAQPEVKKMDISVREGQGVSKGPNGDVKHWITSSAVPLPDMITPGSVVGGFCRMDKEDIEHLRGRYLELTRQKRDGEGAGEVCGPHWKIANGLQQVRVSVGRPAQGDTFRFCQSADDQTQRNDQVPQ